MLTIINENTGVDIHRLERIRPALQSFVNAHLAPGFQVAVMRRGQMVYHDCFGWQDIEAGIHLKEDAIFRIYSMTKPITTAALMMLYEEGRILLVEPVARYIPAFKNLKVWAGEGKPLEPLQRDITILDLALHTSGLGYGLFTDSPVEDLFRSAGFIRYDKLAGLVSLTEIIDRVLELPLANQPGSRWRYGIGIDVIGRIIEIVSGCPFDVFLKERIFDPLGMQDTGFYVPPEKLHRMTTMYAPGTSGAITSIDRPDDSPFTNPLIAPSGGGGLLSTTHDYLRFLQMMLNGGELDRVRILGSRTIAKMARNHLPAPILPIMIDEMPLMGLGFGPGFGVVMDSALANMALSDGSYYWGGAASTAMFIDPREQMVGVLMTQVLNNMVPFNDFLLPIVYGALAA